MSINYTLPIYSIKSIYNFEKSKIILYIFKTKSTSIPTCKM